MTERKTGICVEDKRSGRKTGKVCKEREREKDNKQEEGGFKTGRKEAKYVKKTGMSVEREKKEEKW